MIAQFGENTDPKKEVMNALVFRKSLGMNDTKVLRTLKNNPTNGETQLTEALNVTPTPDGALEKLPGFKTVYTHSAPITNLSAGSTRLLYQDATNTYELVNLTTPVTRFPNVVGPMVHTNVDCRVSTDTKVYKSHNTTLTMAEAVLGTNPNPYTSKPFYGMPAFTSAFVYNAKLYAINKADGRFMQYSEDYNYDLWAIGDSFFAHQPPVLQAGAIVSEKSSGNGCIVTVHAGGVQLYDGSGPSDFTSKFYPCDVLSGTLFSGFINKTQGYKHLFLCNDGLYAIDPDGNLENLTLGVTTYLDSLNTSYSGAVVIDGKYFAFGNNCTFEYDFLTKAWVKHAALGVTGIAVLTDNVYLSVGNNIVKFDATIDANLSTKMVFPFSDLGVPTAKSISDLYFTGTCTGTLRVTATDNTGNSWVSEWAELGTVFNKDLRVPRIVLGNHISFTVESLSGAFRLETFDVSFRPSQRVL